MDDNGSIGLCYLTTGKVPVVTSPGLRYTGRLSTDPLGQMTFAEQIAVEGAGASDCGERIGDYSHTALDPDGLTFWHTNHYINNGSKSRVFSFQIQAPLSAENFQNEIVFNAYQSNESLNVIAQNLNNQEDIQIDLFDITGKHITGKKMDIIENKVETSININGLSKGIYLVRIGNYNFQKVLKIIIK